VKNMAQKNIEEKSNSSSSVSWTPIITAIGIILVLGFIVLWVLPRIGL
jgi:hypothetical protein